MAVVLLAALVPLGIRGLERLLTFHPVAYDGGPRWELPPDVQDEWIAGTGGTRLHAWRFRFQKTPRAVLVHNHGNGGNLTNISALATDMAGRGYEVLLWDYRGYGRSEGDLPSDEETLFADGAAVFDHARRLGKPVAVWGQSLGTTVSTDVCSRRPCAALVLESGLSSGRDYARTQVSWIPTPLHIFAKFTFASAEKLPRVSAPVLIAHGTADRTIAYSHGERLFAAAPAARRRLLRIDGGTHWLASTPGYWNQVAAFLDQSLPH